MIAHRVPAEHAGTSRRRRRAAWVLSASFALALLAGGAVSARAAVPRTIAFQGFLTDAGGQPLEGAVNLDIAVYNAATGGTALWTETHAGVPVSKGVFAVALGSVSPLSGAVANTSPRFIGIRVNGEAELPRTELRAAPFALRAQAADSVTAGINIKEGNFSAMSSQFSTQGELNLEWRCRDFNQMVAKLGAGFNGDGTLALFSNSGASSIEAYGSRFGEPFLGLYGNEQSAFIDLDSGLDNSIRLPSASINSVELFNEPGLASTIDSGFTALTATAASVRSRTMVLPSGGYVLALGQGVARISHTNGTATSGVFGLSDDGIGFAGAQDVNVIIPGSAPSGSYAIPVHVNAVFDAASLSSLTVHLLGREDSGAIEIEDVSLTLLYVPTSYGTVTPALQAADDADDTPARGTQTPSEVLAERLASQEANTARLERELAEVRAAHLVMRAEMEAMRADAAER